MMSNQNQAPNSKTLWVGDIENWMDEDYLMNMFANTGAQVNSAKIIKDHNTGIPLGYGFVEFGSNEVANKVLQLLNTSINPATNKPFKLNWGQDRGSNQMMGYKGGMMRGGMGFNNRWNNQGGRGQNYNQNQQGNPQQVYVGDLDQSVNETLLLEHFKQRYLSATSAKIIIDMETQVSKGFGFVEFTSKEEAQSSIQEMQGTVINGMAIKCSQTFKNYNFKPYQQNKYNNQNMMNMGGSGGFGNQNGGYGMGQMGGYNNQYGGFPNQMGMSQYNPMNQQHFNPGNFNHQRKY